MSGHCPKCGTYHEEDDNRVCGACARRSDTNEGKSDAARIAGLESILAAVTAERDAWRNYSAALKVAPRRWTVEYTEEQWAAVERAMSRTPNRAGAGF